MPSIQKPKKRTLTQAEKAQIRSFYRNNPLVTHSHVARVFGLERSTVSKILGAAPPPDSHDSLSQPSPPSIQSSADVSPILAPVVESTDLLLGGGGQVDQSTIMRALTRWARQKQEQGVRVTQQMIRQEAAALSTINMPQTTAPCILHETAPRAVTPSALHSWSGKDTFDPVLSDKLLSAGLCDDISSYPYGATSTPATATTHKSFADMFAAPEHSPFPALTPCNSSSSPGLALQEPEHDLLSALDNVTGHLSAEKPLTTLDAVCVEHLRERILSCRRDSGTTEGPVDYARTLPSLANLMCDQHFW